VDSNWQEEKKETEEIKKLKNQANKLRPRKISTSIINVKIQNQQ